MRHYYKVYFTSRFRRPLEVRAVSWDRVLAIIHDYKKQFEEVEVIRVEEFRVHREKWV